MVKVESFNEHVPEYEAWFERQPEAFRSEIAALKEHMESLPAETQGIQVGVGTGRYAVELGIKEGVEPAPNMREIAVERGIETIVDVAESLPYGDLRFDFVLFATIYQLNDFKKAVDEARRVLKKGGTIIIGFLDRERPIAQRYMEKHRQSAFYKNATFYTPQQVADILQEENFIDLRFNQTLFGESLEEITGVQLPREGFGEGSYVAVRATKK